MDNSPYYDLLVQQGDEIRADIRGSIAKLAFARRGKIEDRTLRAYPGSTRVAVHGCSVVQSAVAPVHGLGGLVGSGAGAQWIQEATAHMKKGAFTKQSLREGETPMEYAAEVLAHPEEHTLKTRRRAQFLKNVAARKKGRSKKSD